MRVLKGDESIVNCIQPHPYSCYLATSGIDPQIRVWSPRLGDLEKQISGEHEEEEEDDERIVTDINSASANNQIQMNSHPFEFLFLNLTQNNGSQLLFTENHNQLIVHFNIPFFCLIYL